VACKILQRPNYKAYMNLRYLPTWEVSRRDVLSTESYTEMDLAEVGEEGACLRFWWGEIRVF